MNLPESLGYRVKKRLLGKPLVNDELHGEKLSNPTALGIMGIDMISSSAYGSEQMLTQLVPYFGALAFMLVMPITGVILGMLILLTLSYREVVRSTPRPAAPTWWPATTSARRSPRSPPSR